MGLIPKNKVGRPWKNINRNEEVVCACGCGRKRKKYDVRGRERKYLYHHNPVMSFKKGHVPWHKGTKGLITGWAKGKHPKYLQGENHYMWKGGMPKCSDCGKTLGSYRSQKCRSCRFKTPGKLRESALKNLLIGLGKQQNRKEPTSIEKKLYEELKLRGLLFEPQKLISGKFWVDAYIPGLNLIIEADGNYWHSLDRATKRDRSKDAYLTKCGYNILRLSETEINNGSFKERLVS